MARWFKRLFKRLVPAQVLWFPRYYTFYRSLGRADKDILMLDAGCGEGIVTYELARRGFRIIGVDIYAGAMNLKAKATAGNGAAFIACDLANLPFKNGSFGFIFSLDVLELFTDIDGVFSELGRVLKDGGILTFSLPEDYVCSAKLFPIQRLIRKIIPSFLRTRDMPDGKTWLETTSGELEKKLGRPAGYSPDKAVRAAEKRFAVISRQYYNKLFTSLATDMVYGIKGLYYLRFPLFYIAVRLDRYLLKKTRGYALFFEMKKKR